MLNASLQGQTISIPVFVNKVGTARHSADLPPAAGRPDGHAGQGDARCPVRLGRLHDPGRIHERAREASTSGPGVFTPYTPNVGVPNAAGTVEWRTYVGLPSTLTLAKAKTKKGIKLVGRLAVNGLSPRGIRLDLYAGRKGQPAPSAVSRRNGKRVAKTGRLSASGKYSLSRPSVKFSTFFQARLENYATPCTGASPTGLAAQVHRRGHRRRDL